MTRDRDLSARCWLRQLLLCPFRGPCAHDAMPKHLIRGAIKAIAGIAVVVFILARMTTNTGLLLFVGSIVVLIVCFGLLKLLEGEMMRTRPIGQMTRSSDAEGF